MAEITHRVDSQNQTDDALRQNVLNKARELDLPVKADNVHIIRSPEGLRIDVRYFVRVTLPGYTVTCTSTPAPAAGKLIGRRASGCDVWRTRLATA